MKKLLFIILMMLSVLPAAEAQNVVGKWKCSEEFLDGLGTLFVQMCGRYHFKKDGTFIVKTKGLDQGVARKRKKGKKNVATATDNGSGTRRKTVNLTTYNTLKIKVKGTYYVSNGTITTRVDPEDVACSIDTCRDLMEMPSVNGSNSDREMSHYLMNSRDNDYYSLMSRTQEETIKRDLADVWNWNSEPLEVTKKTMTVGDKVTFKR